MSTTKKPAKIASRKSEAPVVRNDGQLYGVFSVKTGRQVYPGPGLAKSDAARFATGLLDKCYIKAIVAQVASA
jgi:hypothetical protein